MEPNGDGIHRCAHQRGDLLWYQLLPVGQHQHFTISRSQLQQSHVDRRVPIGAARRIAPIPKSADTVGQAFPPPHRPSAVRHDSTRHPIDPQQRFRAGWKVVEAAPDNQENISDRIVDLTAGYPAAEIGSDLVDTLVIHLPELCLSVDLPVGH